MSNVTNMKIHSDQHAI